MSVKSENESENEKKIEAPSAISLIEVIKKGCQNILKTDVTDMTAYLGANFISQYYLVCSWLGWLDKTSLDLEILLKILEETQMEDGSWQNVVEINSSSGGIDFTIFNYWGMKAMGLLEKGTEKQKEMLAKAKDFILSKGGLDKCTTMTKIWLCLFGNYPWSKLFSVPLWIFKKSVWNMAYAEDLVSQWVYPHLMPMAFHIKSQTCKLLGVEFDLPELYCSDSRTWQEHIQPFRNKLPARLEKEVGLIPPAEELNLLEKMFGVCCPNGSFGAYTVSSLFTVMCFDVFHQKYKADSYDKEKLEKSALKVFDFVEGCYFRKGKGSYWGVLDHGEFWDIILTRTALLESGLRTDQISKDGQFILDQMQDNGGIPFGTDFWYAPDVDDTAETITFLQHLINDKEDDKKVNKEDDKNDVERIKKSIEKMSKWLIEMQNSDGGYGAFHKGHDGRGILHKAIGFVAAQFYDSAAVFDYSSVDLTGHILEAWGLLGMNVNESHVKKAIKYIQANQTNFGGFKGRWGTNYIYGTSAALVGLKRIGYNFQDSKWIQKACDWLVSVQNEDGGWGETTEADNKIELAGRGKSTHSQTAWAMQALIEGEIGGCSIEKSILDKAATFLVSEFKKNSCFFDISSVGTGHPGILYMQYPSYAFAFPVIALCRYLKLRHNISNAHDHS